MNHQPIFKLNQITAIVIPLADGYYRVEKVETKVPWNMINDHLLIIDDFQLTGLWHPTLSNFSQIDVVFDTLKLLSISDNSFLTIDKILLNANLTQDENDRWTGTESVILEEISVESPRSSLTIDRLALLEDYHV